MDNIILNKINKRCEEKNYTFLGFDNGNYKNTNTRLILQCNKDLYIWQPTYVAFIHSKTGCPKCSNTIKKTKDEMILDIIKICSDKEFEFIGFVDEKINTKSKFEVRCLKDNHVWQPNYNNFVIKNSGCPVCGNTLMRSEDSALNIINELCDEKNYKFNGFIGDSYSGANVKLNVACNHCNCKWTPSYYNFVHNNSGCPNCRKSKGELTIVKYLKENNIKFLQQKTFEKCKDKKLLQFDFYLPNHNTCIEFDGSQHFIPKEIWGGDDNLKSIQKRDEIKNNFCIENNIKLLRISYKQNIIDELINLDLL